jgi:F-box/leucine-rich repeat protein 10/11
VGDKYLKDIKAKEEFPPRVVESIEALADFLVAEARIMERGTEAARKEAREQVPGDRIKDAPALARELRWRIKQIAGHASDGEDESKTINGHKRKLEDDSPAMFRNFRPRKWDRMIDRSSQEEVKSLAAQKPDSLDNWTDGWIDTIEPNSDEAGEEAELRRSRTVIVKARRTETGVERQRIERILEHWTWRDGREEEKLEID